jgi:hypothetical protein
LGIVFFLSGTSLVQASAGSIPGDTLYPLKRAVETVRLGIASGDQEVALRENIVEERQHEELVKIEREKELVTIPEAAPGVGEVIAGIFGLSGGRDPVIVATKTARPVANAHAGQSQSAVVFPPQVVNTVSALKSPTPTALLFPTALPSSTATFIPTLPPTSTPTDEPTLTSTPVPTNTPAPTDTRVPTATPVPTDTSVPTATPAPTDTRVPTETLVPEPTDVPTSVPVPTDVPTLVPTDAPTDVPTPVPTLDSGVLP